MKLFIILLLFVESNYIFAQNFFPMEISDNVLRKQKFEIKAPRYSSTWTKHHIYTVTSQIAYNDLTFYKFAANNNDYKLIDTSCYYSYDSVTQKLYIKIPEVVEPKMIADFNIPYDSVFETYLLKTPQLVRCMGTSYQIIGDDTLLTWTMRYLQPTSYFLASFTDKIGLSNYYHYRSIGVDVGERIIDTVVSLSTSVYQHNIPYLRIDTLFPIFDRPINTFPFMIFSNYVSNFSNTIYKFILELHVTRNDSIIYSEEKNFTEGRIQISFPDSLLHINDIIHLRAVAKDSSYLLNIAYKPDVGVFKIKVLPKLTDDEDNSSEVKFNLFQNYPNPFNPSTKIKFTIPSNGMGHTSTSLGNHDPSLHVSLKIYDILGNEVAILVNEERQPGEYEIEFNAQNLPGGVYFYQMRVGNFFQTKKLVLMR